RGYAREARAGRIDLLHSAILAIDRPAFDSALGHDIAGREADMKPGAVDCALRARTAAQRHDDEQHGRAVETGHHRPAAGAAALTFAARSVSAWASPSRPRSRKNSA